ncbi:MAG: insulinase family protein [Clostridia bacterium]|nr:insulinase family protein [Clostridia bacterium]
MPVTITSLGNGVDGLFYRDNRFRTTLISFNFYLPLSPKTVAANALLPFLMTTCSKEYPDFSKLNYKLNKLYGAQLEAVAEKHGDLQLLQLSISVIHDRFALDEESLTEQACDLLMQMIFEPKVENGAFFAEDVEREKRKAVEHIYGEMNNKRLYAKTKMLSAMFRDDVYGTPKCGTAEQVEALTGEELYQAWRHMLKHAKVRVHVLSNALPNNLFTRIAERFSTMERTEITDCQKIIPTKPCKTVQHLTERMDVAQGKLVMGFSSRLNGNDTAALPLTVMCDLFGGGPYSKLFANVREKMSLCYYCSASSYRGKGLLLVDSGVEMKNADRAEQEILKQLESVQRGEFGDFEYQASLKSISDSVRAANDSQNAMNLWFSLRIADENLWTPDDFAAQISTVTREQIIDAANGIQLHTVYRLLPKEKEENHEANCL